MKNPWSYSTNVFANISNHNFKLLYAIAKNHDAYLAGVSNDPEIVAIYNTEHPSCQDYLTKYDLWFGMYNAKEAAAQSFRLRMNTLGNTKAVKWDVWIQSVYAKGTPEYTNLLANGRAPLQKGSYASRLSAVNALILNISDDAALADLKTDIIAYALVIHTAFEAKNAVIVKLKAAQNILEAARKAHAVVMFGALILLMLRFVNNPKEIEKFYNMELIRTKNTAKSQSKAA
ncbi:MAG: hypothetical protein NTX03_01595 [Bacteroidetes bacterium]|nr:hypothetical protein [Bacteroidota bacterium]